MKSQFLCFTCFHTLLLWSMWVIISSTNQLLSFLFVIALLCTSTTIYISRLFSAFPLLLGSTSIHLVIFYNCSVLLQLCCSIHSVTRLRLFMESLGLATIRYYSPFEAVPLLVVIPCTRLYFPA